jgi:hypothetical protein
VKSQEYLQNQDGDRVLSNSSLPYLFTNTFSEPLKINPSSTIELVSGDLNIESRFNITNLAKNNILSFGIGTEEKGFFQVSIRIPDGEYSAPSLAIAMEIQMNSQQNMDMAKFAVIFAQGKFNIDLIIQNGVDNVWDTVENSFDYLSKNIGFQEEPDSGVGTYDGTAEMIKLPTTNQIQSTSVARILNNPQTQATSQSPFLLSNSFTPNSNGVLQNGGNVSMIIRPIQQYTFNPATYYTNSAAFNVRYRFSYINASGNRAIFQYSNQLLSPYTGSNGYDFQLPGRYFKIMTEADFATTTFPTGTAPVLDKNYVPWGHWLLCNATDIPVPNAITSNFMVFYLDSDGTTAIWKEYRADYSNPDIWFEQDPNVQTPTFIQTQATKVSLGKYGSAALSLTRGETAITGDNQVNVTNKYTRARVVNTTPKTALEYVDNQVYADYTLQLTPNVAGTDTLINMGYGIQSATKVAGDTDWMSLFTQTQSAARSLKNRFGDTFNWGVDNIIITATVFNYTCVRYTINHDDGGDLNFAKTIPVEMGSTIPTTPASVLKLPTNFTQGSFPIMPVISCANSYTVKDPSVLVFGNYSIKPLSNNLKNLSAYMTSNFGNTRTIPIRQTYLDQSTAAPCVDLNMNSRTANYEAKGFANKVGNYSLKIPHGVVRATGSQGKIAAIIRFALISTVKTDPDYKTITNNGFDIEPNNESSLGKIIGMEDLLSYITTVVGDVPKWSSTGSIDSNSTSNYMINVTGIGNILGQNGATKSISSLVAVVSDAELSNTINSTERHYSSKYSNPVKINAPGEELVRNFDIHITRDDGAPADNLSHPTTFLFKID